MDLLGGYSSNSDGENSDSDNESQNSRDEINTSTLSQPQLKPNPQPKPKTGSTLTASITKQKKKLLSLNAVLPSEIFERLTRASHEDDSSSDEEDDENNKRSHRNSGSKVDSKVQSSKKTQKTRSLPNDNLGISSLLNDLKSNVASKSKQKKTSSETSNFKIDDKEEREVMGFAFTNVITTTVKREKNKAEVIQIHGIDKKEQQSEPAENIKSRSGIDLPPSAPPAPPPPPSRFNMNLPRPSSTSSNAVLRPLNKSISAAPSVSSSTTLPRPMAAYPVPQQYNPADYQKTQTQTQTQSKPILQQTSKKSKRQIQQALRSGNFSEISDDLITNVHNQSTTHSFNIPSNNQGSSSYIKSVASSEIYDPKQGRMVANFAEDGAKMSGKMRGKHQIHHLVHSARVLEANRRLHGHPSSNASRVDAKRKYGW